MKTVDSFTWMHLWLLLTVAVCLGVGIAYLCPTEMATERGIGAIIVAVLIPTYFLFFQWLIKKFPHKKRGNISGGDNE